MASVLVIFNGIKFPYYLMDYALAQAKEQSASLHALFLKAGKESAEGYMFPNDLQQAETITSKEDALEDDERIIRDLMKLAGDMAVTENVSCTTECLTDSPLADVLNIVDRFTLVCIDAAYDEETAGMLNNKKFSTKRLIAQATAPVKLVSEEDIVG